ncbi:MAG: DUF3995 domain-containing protein [Alphaproteobacteria bacterium]
MRQATRRVAVGLFVALTALAALHVYWGLGGLWPGKTEAELINTVVGAPDFVRMPPAWMAHSVGGLLVLAGLFGLSASGAVPLGWAWFSRLATGVIALVFVGRGMSGYVVPRIGIEQTEPFATLDQLLYSPLCLVLGLGFVFLTWRGR